jgi:hypothetical protein
MDYSYETDGRPDLNKTTTFMGQKDRLISFSVVSWSLFCIWVGFAWLMGFSLGWILLGVGILMLAMQGARRMSRVKADGFWIIVGVALLMGGLWELWGAAIPLLPVVLIAAGIGQLVCCRA